MADDRLICVIGTASGGTSAVAGVLHRLGVDMGDHMPRPGVRGYTTFEDRALDRYKDRDRPTPVDPFTFHLPAYVDDRLGTGTRPRGVKFSPGILLDHIDRDAGDDAGVLRRLRVVHVTRPLERCVASEIARYTDVLRRPDTATLAGRVAHVARGWWAARAVCERLRDEHGETVVVVDYAALTTPGRTHAVVRTLRDAVGIDDTVDPGSAVRLITNYRRR